ncbi:IMO32 Probable alcohol acetyltransferase [Candida maltosa Xu316]|uniref:Alpha/beta hydrolase, putative n=1 Tax=Candida maltosa (strain Xu316) TaxID=1245528 RepID=M3HTC1_CANMX|nr:Alpha/beta hydrolase, putative [Candida maltosa Xu316]
MFSIRPRILSSNYLIAKRFLATAAISNLPKPTFNVEEIRDLPYEDNVNLAWKQLVPYKLNIPKTNTPILFLHGLFGSKNSFNAVGRELSAVTRHPVYAVDLRNHGDSPHALPHTYTIMAHDVNKFIQERNWDECILVGHSMGAKVAMLVSLLYPELVSKLVVIDNTPHSKPLDVSFYKDLLGMCEVEAKGEEYKGPNGKTVEDVKKVDAFLEQYQKSKKVRDLLTSNLFRTRKDFQNRRYHSPKKEMFKVPVMNFYKYGVLDTIGSWPSLPDVDKFDKPVMVMYGEQSDFVLPEYHEQFDKYFTNVSYTPFDAGHWISVDSPGKFITELTKFIIPDFVNKPPYKKYKYKFI